MAKLIPQNTLQQIEATQLITLPKILSSQQKQSLFTQLSSYIQSQEKDGFLNIKKSLYCNQIETVKNALVKDQLPCARLNLTRICYIMEQMLSLVQQQQPSQPKTQTKKNQDTAQELESNSTPASTGQLNQILYLQYWRVLNIEARKTREYFNQHLQPQLKQELSEIQSMEEYERSQSSPLQVGQKIANTPNPLESSQHQKLDLTNFKTNKTGADSPNTTKANSLLPLSSDLKSSVKVNSPSLADTKAKFNLKPLPGSFSFIDNIQAPYELTNNRGNQQNKDSAVFKSTQKNSKSQFDKYRIKTQGVEQKTADQKKSSSSSCSCSYEDKDEQLQKIVPQNKSNSQVFNFGNASQAYIFNSKSKNDIAVNSAENQKQKNVFSFKTANFMAKLRKYDNDEESNEIQSDSTPKFSPKKYNNNKDSIASSNADQNSKNSYLLNLAAQPQTYSYEQQPSFAANQLKSYIRESTNHSVETDKIFVQKESLKFQNSNENSSSINATKLEDHDEIDRYLLQDQQSNSTPKNQSSIQQHLLQVNKATDDSKSTNNNFDDFQRKQSCQSGPQDFQRQSSMQQEIPLERYSSLQKATNSVSELGKKPSTYYDKSSKSSDLDIASTGCVTRRKKNGRDKDKSNQENQEIVDTQQSCSPQKPKIELEKRKQFVWEEPSVDPSRQGKRESFLSRDQVESVCTKWFKRANSKWIELTEPGPFDEPYPYDDQLVKCTIF